MGLLNKRTIAKAKALAEKNKEKIASGVDKATDVIDKKTGGKHTDKLKKIDEAAKKFAGDDAAAATADEAGDAAATDAAS
jgi:MT0933-like antitoxin protein